MTLIISLYCFLFGHLVGSQTFILGGDDRPQFHHCIFGFAVLFFGIFLSFTYHPDNNNYIDPAAFVLVDRWELVLCGVLFSIAEHIYIENFAERFPVFKSRDESPPRTKQDKPLHRLGPWRRNDQFADEELDLRAQTLIRLMGLTFPTLNRNLIAALERELELSRTQKKPALELLQRSRDEQTRLADLRSSVARLPGGGYDILRFAMRGVCNIAVTAGQNTPEVQARLSDIAAQLGLRGTN